MRRRLLRSTLAIALVAVVVLGLPLGVVGTELLHQRADMRLERRADAVALRVARAESSGTPLTTALVADLLPPHQAVQITKDGRRITLGSLPTHDVTRVTSGDGGPLRATLVAPSGVRGDDVGTVWVAIAGLAVLALGAAVALATVQSRRLAAPLEELSRRVERVGEPTYDDGPVTGNVPEIDRVQVALNRADGRLADLIRREREFTANASHQLRTPLTGLRMRLEELRTLADRPAMSVEADAALVQVDRLVATIEHLETAARHRDDAPDRVDVGGLVAEHVDAGRWRSRFDDADRDLLVLSDDATWGRAAPETVRQILDVLLQNALDHGTGRTRVRATSPGDFVRLRVADDGRIGGTDATAIFGRGVGTGSGIGLTVARELARRDGGDLLLVDTAPTTFEALFPAGDPGPTGGPA
ncbi:sensor histidine kinase [Patulibacter minatonensis]|uniref:sensor histidine kinase n=1 Tax=Patulibacter minatonensis TaxID=298163 RepID=UPI00047A3B3F|nr:HAMP domain-containing sensor histidine kinase [Patulibacter minatonensis]